MSWDEIAAWVVLVAVVIGAGIAIWPRHPHPTLSEKDRRDFDDAGEW